MKIELRADGGVSVSGYVNAVERYSKLLPKEKGRDAPGDFREKIGEGVFAESLSRLPQVRMTFDHGKGIGGTDKNLTLKEDNIGLHAEAVIYDEQAISAAKTGRLTGWSVGFVNAYSDYKPTGDGTYKRDIKSLDLLEVALLTMRPAYPATSIEVRDGEKLETRSENDLPEVTVEELLKINEFTRKDLTAEDVYTFPVILCDNEIDRDNERFSIAALHKLAELFVGKTGIFDHDPSGHNQSARIYETSVITDENHPMTAAGEPYMALSAKAYMVRTAANADLIKEIDAGIKKEVSVSCCIGKCVCSVCGVNRYEGPCEHIKGKRYDGKLCYGLLDEPTDAYEWSFVAVPAQPRAGVTKSGTSEKSNLVENYRHEIEILKMKGKIYDEH